ncbi:uncharacterized protein LOC123218399 [Mangifera indica]|uniref:uncharacterized protein LOC123218399 n=1 Tax=Mangifera indica TaxID=29780 RepID=UPI001CF9DFA6|nr:uncharacterized protein LOC123218399 [Mangifera indica]
MQSEEIMEDNSTSGSASTEQNSETVIPIDYDKPAEIETRKRHSKLYGAALKGDWHKAEIIFEKHENDDTAKLSKEGDTALHIAAAAGRPYFVEKLVRKMKKEDLAIKNNAGNTAFFLAAASENVAIVKAMIAENEDLIKIKGDNDMLPLVMAAITGNKEMIEYLYEATAEELLDDFNCIELLVSLINHGLYDIASDLVERHPKKAIARDKSQLTALHHLAKMPVQMPVHRFFFDCDLIKVGTRLLIKLCNCVINRCCSALRRGRMTDINTLSLRDRIKEREHRWTDQISLGHRFCKAIVEVLCEVAGEETPPSAFALIRHLWEQVILLDDSEISEIIRKPWPLMFEAAKRGNEKFLDIIWETYPDMMFEVDENHYTIFHFAVMYRHYHVFSFIYNIGPLKDLIVRKTDAKGNNILHLAAKLPPLDRSIIVSGAPVEQMRLEVFWFKKVKKMLCPVDAEAPNDDGKTASALFTEEHEELRKKAEKWTKGIANACIVAATLIATVAFTAGLTVPGGIKEETGTPNFVQRASFIIFAISDTAALLFSSFSIVCFISLFFYPYEERDLERGVAFVSRPIAMLYMGFFLDLHVGLYSLLYSVDLMMLGFCANMFIVFKDGKLWIPILITAMSAFASIIIWRQAAVAFRKRLR